MESSKISNLAKAEDTLFEKAAKERSYSKLEHNSTNMEATNNGKRGDLSTRKRCRRVSRGSHGGGDQLDLLPDLVMDIPSSAQQRKSKPLQTLGRIVGGPFNKEDFAELEAAFLVSRHPRQDELQELGQKMGKSLKEISTWFARRRIRATKDYVNNIDMASFVPPPPPPLPEETEVVNQQEINAAQANSLTVQGCPTSVTSPSPTPLFQPQFMQPTVVKLKSGLAENSVNSSTINRYDEQDIPASGTNTTDTAEHRDHPLEINNFVLKIKRTSKDREIKEFVSPATISSNSFSAATYEPHNTQSRESLTKKDIIYVKKTPSANCSAETVSLSGCSDGNAVGPPPFRVPCFDMFHKPRVLPKPPPLIRDPFPARPCAEEKATNVEETIRRLPNNHVNTRPPKLQKIENNVCVKSTAKGPMMSGKPWSPPRQSCLKNKEVIEEEDEDRGSPPAVIPIDWVYPDFRHRKEPTECTDSYGNEPLSYFGFRYSPYPLHPDWLWHTYAARTRTALSLTKNLLRENGKPSGFSSI